MGFPHDFACEPIGAPFSAPGHHHVFFPGFPGRSMRELRPCSTWALDDVLTSADYHHLDPRLWVSNCHRLSLGNFNLADLTNKLLQKEHNLCFLNAFENIHPGQRWITFPSAFCVSDVGRSIITRYHPLINLQDFKTFGEWKCDRSTTKLHARILRLKGVQRKKPNMFTVGRLTSATFVLLVYLSSILPEYGILSPIFGPRFLMGDNSFPDPLVVVGWERLHDFIYIYIHILLNHGETVAGWATSIVRTTRVKEMD